MGEEKRERESKSVWQCEINIESFDLTYALRIWLFAIDIQQAISQINRE